MNILKIKLKSPITNEEVDRLIAELIDLKTHEFLIIDFGEHDFENIDVMKYCKDQLYANESHLLEFKKIAMLHPGEFRNESSNPEKLNYFNSVVEAREWFLI